MSVDELPAEQRLIYAILYSIAALVAILLITSDFWVAFTCSFVFLIYLVIYRYRIGG
jgi:hypothetical protein